MISNAVTFNQSSLHIVNWPVRNVRAFTTTCHHPFRNLNNKLDSLVSPYGQFNLGLHVGDDPQQVINNRECLLPLLKTASHAELKIQWLDQVHGTEIADIIEYQAKPIVADAAITSRSDIALAIMTADCLPILLASENGTEIAAIHGGWRPLAGNIINKTIEKMNTDVTSIHAWLGPCIGKTAFEVGAEVKAAFDKVVEHNEQYFQPIVSVDFQSQSNINNAKFLADLQGIATSMLKKLGVSSVTTLPHCTYTDTSQYYSFRRNSITGRMASVICRT